MKWISLMVGTLAILAFSSLGCDSSSTGGCKSNTECGQGSVCDGGSCKMVECDNIQQCLEYGDDVFCAGEGVSEANPDTKYCSPIMCKGDDDCADGEVCDEFKQCVPGVGSETDVVVGPDAGGEDVVGPGPDTTEPTGEGGCTICTSDTDCDAGLHCHPLGGGTFCFADCEDTDECSTGWMCYQLGNEGKQCIPMAFQCEPECLQTGCPKPQVCNQETGACQEPAGECGTCQQDWDCGEGFRCYMNGHYCAPVCPDAVCPTNGTCEQVNSIPMHLCVSQSVTCCYGDECGGEQCPPEAPFVYDGGCVECLEDSHCGADTCGPDHTCVSSNCTDPTKPYDLNGQCVECLTSVHCEANEVCDGNICKPSEQPDECTYCQSPYPACTQINGVWSCVQCTDDSYCTGTQTCDTTIFACVGEGGQTDNCSGCTSAGDCVSLSGMFELDCDYASGCCYDVAGGCDGVEAFCPGGECVGLLDFLGGGGGMGIPVEGLGMAVCSCNEPADMMSLMMCLMGGCPTGGCAGGAVCVDPAVLTDLLGGGGGSTPSETGYCINLSSLLGGLF